jgi:hypothetical protein
MNHPRRNARRTAVVLGLLYLTAQPIAWAVDGVFEINQACVAGGCFPGDAAGFPVETSKNQSYRLTGDLVASGVDAIVLAKHASLDLGGFSISGNFSRTAVTVAQGASVTHGTIRGFLNGIAGADATAKLVRISNMRIEDGGFLGTGVRSYDHWLIVDSFIVGSGGDGLIVVGDAIIRGCVASDNNGDGIAVQSGNVQITGSVLSGNSAAGLRVTGGSVAIGENVINGNGTNQIDGAFVQIAKNMCGGNTTCP